MQLEKSTVTCISNLWARSFLTIILLFVDLHNLFIYLFSNFHLEETKKKALNEGLTKGLKVPARPAALRS